RGAKLGADLVLCPELSVTGYPPRDLLLKKRFLAQNLEVLDRLGATTDSCGLVVGYVGENQFRPGREVTNSVAWLQQGRVVATRNKSLPPPYDVYDEARYSDRGVKTARVDYDGVKLGLTICKDIWNDEVFWPDRRYPHTPPVELAEAGAGFLFNISASP